MAAVSLGYLTKLPAFEYLEPETVEEVCSLLSTYGGAARVLAGGTDLLVSLKKRELAPRYVINLKAISALNYIRYDGAEGLTIGALATLSQIEHSAVVKERFPLVAEAAYRTGPSHIRNMGTMVGNICNADAAADSVPALLALGAKVRAEGKGRVRTIPLVDFLLDSRKTALATDEIVTEIQIPVVAAGTKGAFIKLPERTAVDISVVSVAAVVTREGEKIIDASIVLGAVGPIAMRARNAESILRGRIADGAVIRRAAEAASDEAKPRTRHDYKRRLVRTLTQRALTQAMDRP